MIAAASCRLAQRSLFVRYLCSRRIAEPTIGARYKYDCRLLVAIEGNEIAPVMIDQYLARTNYEAQQTDEPVEANRRDNLWSLVPGDHGAHGSFDARRIISARKHG